MPSRALFLTALTLALGVACTQSTSDACGKGEVYRDGDCHPAPAASAGTAGSAAAASAGAAGAGGDAGGGAPGAAIDPNFGLACSVDADCTGVTNYCVPKSPFGDAYCSVSDCAPTDASACPAGWACTDLSMFVSGLPFACTQPVK